MTTSFRAMATTAMLSFFSAFNAEEHAQRAGMLSYLLRALRSEAIAPAGLPAFW